MISVLEDKIKSLVHLLLLKGKFDGNNAIMEIKAGAGGTEAQDWVEMLYRQFTRFFTRKGFSCKVIDYQAGEAPARLQSTPATPPRPPSAAD